MNAHFHHKPLEASQQALAFVRWANALQDRLLSKFVGLIQIPAPDRVGGEQD